MPLPLPRPQSRASKFESSNPQHGRSVGRTIQAVTGRMAVAVTPADATDTRCWTILALVEGNSEESSRDWLFAQSGASRKKRVEA